MSVTEDCLQDEPRLRKQINGAPGFSLIEGQQTSDAQGICPYGMARHLEEDVRGYLRKFPACIVQVASAHQSLRELDSNPHRT
jgi:hypothetical protein